MVRSSPGWAPVRLTANALRITPLPRSRRRATGTCRPSENIVGGPERMPAGYSRSILRYAAPRQTIVCGVDVTWMISARPLNAERVVIAASGRRPHCGTAGRPAIANHNCNELPTIGATAVREGQRAGPAVPARRVVGPAARHHELRTSAGSTLHWCCVPPSRTRPAYRPAASRSV